jgi:hypothetical protein
VQRLQVRGIVHGEKRARYGYTVGELESMESEAGACLSLSYLVVYPLWYKNRCQVVGKHDNVDSHRNCHFQLIHQTCCFPTTTGSSLQLSVSPAFLLLPVADTSLIATLLSLSGFLQPSPNNTRSTVPVQRPIRLLPGKITSSQLQAGRTSSLKAEVPDY